MEDPRTGASVECETKNCHGEVSAKSEASLLVLTILDFFSA